MSTIIRTLTTILGLVLLIAAACGDDNDDVEPSPTLATATQTGSPTSGLKPPDSETPAAASYKLIIHRADGTEEVLHLTGPPIVCGMMDNGDIIELCGTQVDGPAVDFIQVNESLGESYEVIEE